MPNKECSHSKLFREKFLSREKSQIGKTYIRNHETSSRNERGCMGWTLKIVT